MKQRFWICWLVLGWLTCSSCLAETYIGAGFSGSVEAGALQRGVEEYVESSGTPWKGFVGFGVGKYLAFEAAYLDLGTRVCCDQVADFGFHTDIEALSASVVGRWTATRVSLFARAGVLSWDEKGEQITIAGLSPFSAEGTDLILGSGIDIDLASGWFIRAEWERYEFDDVTSDSFWGAVSYRF